VEERDEGWMGRGRSRGNAVGKEEAGTAQWGKAAGDPGLLLTALICGDSGDRLMWVPREAVEAQACEARFFRYEAGCLTFDDRSGFRRANFLTYEAFFGFFYVPRFCNHHDLKPYY
jgi:hypothetical protein